MSANVIRRLAPGDEILLDALRACLETVFEADEPGSHAPGAPRPTGTRLAALLASPTFIAIAALDGDEVMGGLTGYELPKLEAERSEVYLYDLAVVPSHRRRGVATALIAELRREAVRRGAHAVFVQADRGDDAAIALYSGLGQREDVHHFDIDPRVTEPLSLRSEDRP